MTFHKPKLKTPQDRKILRRRIQMEQASGVGRKAFHGNPTQIRRQINQIPSDTRKPVVLFRDACHETRFEPDRMSRNDRDIRLPRTYVWPQGINHGSRYGYPLDGSERLLTANPVESRVYKTYRRVLIRGMGDVPVRQYLSVLPARSRWWASGERYSHAPYSRLDLGARTTLTGGGLAEAEYCL